MLRRTMLLVALVFAPVAVSAQQELEIPPEVMEAIRSDVATVHMDLMQSTLLLQPGQAGSFWSVYDEYLVEVQSLTQQRTELLRDFAAAFQDMDDEAAIQMGRRALEIDARRHQLLSDYFERIASQVSGVIAGQFLQIENRIATVKDLRLELEVPVIGRGR